jgi:formylglycine-generating enzyme required for sulfatase activity
METAVPKRLLDVVAIPEGAFWMGSDQHQENEAPCHRVWIDRFALGRFPVTNRLYKIYVEETRVAAPVFWCEGMFCDPDQPVVGVTWYEATAFCRWLSRRTDGIVRLPTEAEWERAARGRREKSLYPWGDEPPSERPFQGYNPRTGGPERVGVNEPNEFGLYDMSEGVHEWCSDYYDRDYYRASAANNPQGAASGKRRASRGGSWRHHIKFSRCAARSSLPPDFRYADYGFRIAITLNSPRHLTA